jgi:V/A-type H+-transporting ATPase subunit E
MAQNVQELINKIKQDGLQAAEQKAQEIEAAAEKKADDLIAQAQAQAQKILADAQARQKQLEESSRVSLTQAARDTVLSLKKAIHDLLDKIVRQEIHGVLTPEQMAGMILELVKGFAAQGADGKHVEVALNDENRAHLEKDLLAKLQKEVKAGIKIRTADDLTGGFTISFDQGRSCFDFSESALAEYLGKYVNEYVGNLLKKD